MPRNGSGTFVLPPGNPVVTQTLITSNWANVTMTDLADGITQSLAKDGQTNPTANLPMAGFRHTGVGDPVARSDYATLGYMQDGKAGRLTNISGVNQIVATLPGGAVALNVGMILQLIPTSTNTGAVTININNIGFVPVLTESGNDLTNGNIVAGSPYILLYNGAAFTVVAGNIEDFNQNAMSGWIRPSSGNYPSITIANPTTVTVPGGTGRIIKPGSVDQSGVIVVTWPTQNVVISAIASQWATQLGVDEFGQIVQFPGGPDPVYARDNVMLGAVAHINGQVNGVSTRPAIYGDMIYAAYDVAALFQNQLIAGGRIQPNGINPFQINVQAGVLFGVGFDPSEINSPNSFEFPDQLNISFFPITGTSGVAAATQNAPITFYDPAGAGVIVAIPGGVNTTVIHRLYYLSSGQFLFLYGQNTYADLTSALSQIAVDSASTIYPAKLGQATLLGYIVAQRNTTNLNNPAQARLVSRGGTDFSIGSSGSISEAPVDGQLYGRVNATWSVATPLPRGPAVTNRFITYFTNALARFTTGINDTPESGGNTGSNFEIRAYNDAGGLTGTAMIIDRVSRVANFPAGLQAGGVPVVPGNYILKAGDTGIGPLSFDGNPTFNGGRIFGKFAGPIADRTYLQGIDPNDNGLVGILPTGTGSTALVQVFNGSDPENSANLQLRANAGNMALNSVSTGVGVLRPLSFQMNNVECGRLNADQSWTFLGPVTIVGRVTADVDFVSSTQFVVLATSAPGQVLLRPVGPNDATGQFIIDQTGFSWGGNTGWHTGNLIPVRSNNPGNALSMSWAGNEFSLTVDAVTRQVVTVQESQTITGRKIFESQTTDGSGDLRVTRVVDSKSGAILFGDDNEVFLFRVNDATDFLNISCELVMGGRVRPGNNAAVDSLGTAGNRWSEVFAATGTINTSDAREKTPLSVLSAAELAAAKALGKAIGTYKWLDAIKSKGAAARKHIGVTAQSVIEVMEAHGLDAMEYGFVCHDAWEASTVQEPFTGEDMVMRSRDIPAGDRYGVRYDELLAFIAAGFEARLAALEGA